MLIELYGNAANDVCSTVVGDKGSSSGCNGASRFGCHQCTANPIDKSSEELVKYPRWRALGVEKALRVRDWLLRQSACLEARAFHAKAIDQCGFNRIALQPNVFRTRILEQMTHYASQLTLDSQSAADEFSELLAQNRLMEHEGYRDIATDTSLSPEIRDEMLSMYREMAQKPLLTCFSERHALALSFSWQMLGVPALPWRPLAIWRDAVAGKRRAYPLSRIEYEAKFGQISLNTTLPDAVMLPFHTKQYEDLEFHPITSPHFLSYHQRPYNELDMFDAEYNCQLKSTPENSLSITATVVLEINIENKLQCHVQTIKLLGKILPARTAALLEADIRQAALNTYSQPGTQTISMSLPYITTETFQGYLSDQPKKVERRPCKTERVIKRTKGSIERLNTRMRFYQATDDQAEQSQITRKPILTLNFDQRVENAWWTTDVHDKHFAQFNNIHVDWELVELWKMTGGMTEALSIHDMHLANALKDRTRTRRFHGTQVVHTLLTQAGFSIKPYYLKTFRAMLSRTELFGEIGAFNFANLSREGILQRGGIEMTQHRQEKIRMVNLIRQHRHEQRQERSEIQSAHIDGQILMSRLQRDVETLVAWAEECLVLVSDGMRVTLTGVQDYTDLDSIKRSKRAELWLSYYTDVLSDSSSLISTVLPQKGAKVFLSSKFAVEFARWYAKRMEPVQTRLASVLQYHQSVYCQCTTLSEQIYKEMEMGPLPAGVAMDAWAKTMMQHFQLNTYEHQVKHTGIMALTRYREKLDCVAASLSLLSELNVKFENQAATGKHQSLKRLSLAERLELLAMSN